MVNRSKLDHKKPSSPIFMGKPINSMSEDELESLVKLLFAGKISPSQVNMSALKKKQAEKKKKSSSPKKSKAH
jgi:hypothetical protein